MRQSLNGPRACHLSKAILPCHPATCLPLYVLTSSVPHVTLTVVTRVTPGLVQLSTCTPNKPAMCRVQRLPRHMYSRTTCKIIMPCGTIRTVQSSHFFACLPFRTECDILLIRSPFEESKYTIEIRKTRRTQWR
jgi:hypothetical protein